MDTIAAIATAPGRGGIGVVRVSGPDASRIAGSVVSRKHPLHPRHAHHVSFLGNDGGAIDQGLALWFPGPDSYTGEDVLELQGHGGVVVMDLLLQRVLELGARMARPGEFTERAFLNGKLDLAQAEAVADLIESSSAAAARAALHSLQGEFSIRVQSMAAEIMSLRTWVEAALDFVEEEIDFLSDGGVLDRVDKLCAGLARVVDEAGQGVCLNEGMTVVIAGRPNAGKSSLLNALAGMERAIVTDVPGTTRDVLRESILVDGMPVHVVDTAGLRETEDRVEREGVRRARAELERADRILLVVDAAREPGAEDWFAAIDAGLRSDPRLSVIRNKIDLVADSPGLTPGPGEVPVIAVSAHTGEGLDSLREHLKACMGYQGEGAGSFVARRRHLDALGRAAEHLALGRGHLEGAGAGDLLAEELRLAHDALGEITGKVSADELLGRIFSSFCIGK